MNLKAFDNEEYISLETYRKTGVAIATPVWFAEKDGVFYIYSVADAGKVKRIRNNPKVRIAPCRFRGELKGDWVEATARIVTGSDEDRSHDLLDKKYGWKKKIGTWYSRLIGRQRAVIAITPLKM
jgi:PPOX class probable F420-dependent enzyme